MAGVSASHVSEQYQIRPIVKALSALLLKCCPFLSIEALSELWGP